MPMICHQLLGAMFDGDVLTVDTEIVTGDMDANVRPKKS